MAATRVLLACRAYFARTFPKTPRRKRFRYNEYSQLLASGLLLEIKFPISISEKEPNPVIATIAT